MKPGLRERKPDYQKLRVRGVRIRDTRRIQPNLSAMVKSPSEGTALMITVDPYAR